MSNDDLNISRELHNIYWASRWQTLTVSGTVHLLLMMLLTFLWMRESYFRHGRVFVVAVPALQISGCESRVASLSRKIFSPSDVCGGVSRCRDSPGECGRRLARVRGCNLLNIGDHGTEICVGTHRNGQQRVGAASEWHQPQQLTPASPLSSPRERIILYYHHHHYPALSSPGLISRGNRTPRTSS